MWCCDEVDRGPDCGGENLDDHDQRCLTSHRRSSTPLVQSICGSSRGRAEPPFCRKPPSHASSPARTREMPVSAILPPLGVGRLALALNLRSYPSWRLCHPNTTIVCGIYPMILIFTLAERLAAERPCGALATVGVGIPGDLPARGIGVCGAGVCDGGGGRICAGEGG